jgi:hypothetical protein
MILISHRGNINGKIPDKENNPEYIDNAIYLDYDVEIDIWFKDNKLWLGHDFPQYNIDEMWLSLRKKNLWIHCKNIEALSYFSDRLNLFNYFWHEQDTVTLTSKKYIWAYPGKQPIKNSIAVMPELNNDNISQCMGVCSDYIQNYK